MDTKTMLALGVRVDHQSAINMCEELLNVLIGISEQSDAQERSGDDVTTLGKANMRIIRAAIAKAKGE